MDKDVHRRHHATMETWQVLAVVAVFVLAGCVKGVTGMGLPTVAMSLLGLMMPPTQAAALLIAPSLATNLAQCRGPYLQRLALRLWPGWVMLAIVTVIAPGLGGAGLANSASRWLGIVLVGYGVWGLWRPALPNLRGSGGGVCVAVGGATGLITATTAVFVLPWVPYLQSLHLSKDEMVQALGLSFTVATLALAVRLQGLPQTDWWSANAILVLFGALSGAFAGLKFGEIMRGRLAGPTFQKALFLVFIALGVANLARSA